jgi:hypothetical protein
MTRFWTNDNSLNLSCYMEDVVCTMGHWLQRCYGHKCFLDFCNFIPLMNSGVCFFATCWVQLVLYFNILFSMGFDRSHKVGKVKEEDLFCF